MMLTLVPMVFASACRTGCEALDPEMNTGFGKLSHVGVPPSVWASARAVMARTASAATPAVARATDILLLVLIWKANLPEARGQRKSPRRIGRDHKLRQLSICDHQATFVSHVASDARSQMSAIRHAKFMTMNLATCRSRRARPPT